MIEWSALISGNRQAIVLTCTGSSEPVKESNVGQEIAEAGKEGGSQDNYHQYQRHSLVLSCLQIHGANDRGEAGFEQYIVVDHSEICCNVEGKESRPESALPNWHMSALPRIGSYKIVLPACWAASPMGMFLEGFLTSSAMFSKK